MQIKRIPVERWSRKNTKTLKTMFSNADLTIVNEVLDIRIGGFFQLSVKKGSWVTISDKGYPLALNQKEFEKHAVTPPSGTCYIYSLEIQEQLAALDLAMIKYEYLEEEKEFPENISIIKWVDDKSIKNFKRMLPDYLISKFKSGSEVFLSLQKEFVFEKSLSQGQWIAVSKDGYPLVLTDKEVKRYVKNEHYECLSICSPDIVRKLAILDSEMKELLYEAAAEEIPSVQVPFVQWSQNTSEDLETLKNMFPKFMITNHFGNLYFKDFNGFAKDYGDKTILTVSPNGYPFELTKEECDYYGNYDEFDFIYDYDIETIIKIRIKRLQNLL